MTTFDRHLIWRFLQIFLILFVSVFGLFTVIDGFSNVDEFQAEGASAWDVLWRMASYYSYKSTEFLDLCGPILTVVDAMIVFALLLRNSELHPILAAGVPVRRLLTPIIMATMVVNGVLVANQELLIPRIADVLQTDREDLFKGIIAVEPLTDHASEIHIGGKELSLNPQLIKNAEFVLLGTRMARLQTTVKASEAAYYPGKEDRPAGWLLKNVDKPYLQLALTEEGRTRIRRVENPKDLFIASDVSFDQLHNRLQRSKLLSTSELIQRLKRPTFGMKGSPELAQQLHARLVRPIANIFAVLVAIPLILRKESRGLVTNMAISAAILSALLGFSEAVAYCGRTGNLAPELSAWLPIFGTGALFAWLTGIMLT